MLLSMGLQRTGHNYLTEQQQPCGVQNSAEKSADNLMVFPLCVFCCFPLVAFNIFSLYLIFINLINMCLGIILLWLILFWTLCTLWTWATVSFPML